MLLNWLHMGRPYSMTSTWSDSFRPCSTLPISHSTGAPKVLPVILESGFISGRRMGAPGLAASRQSVMKGRASHSTATASRARLQASSLSATTTTPTSSPSNSASSPRRGLAPNS